MKVRCGCVALGAQHNNKQQVVVMETARQLVPNRSVIGARRPTAVHIHTRPAATDRPAYIRARPRFSRTLQ